MSMLEWESSKRAAAAAEAAEGWLSELAERLREAGDDQAADAIIDHLPSSVCIGNTISAMIGDFLIWDDQNGGGITREHFLHSLYEQIFYLGKVADAIKAEIPTPPEDLEE